MDSDQDVPGHWVVDGVPRAAAQTDVGDELVASGIDYGVRSAMLIGDENLVLLRCVGQAIGIGHGTGGPDDLERFGIDGRNLVVAGHGRIDAMKLGSDGDAMYTFEAVEIGDHVPRCSVEDHKLVGVHVRDIKTASRWIEGLVVEADSWPGMGTSATMVKTLSAARELCWATSDPIPSKSADVERWKSFIRVFPAMNGIALRSAKEIRLLQSIS